MAKKVVFFMFLAVLILPSLSMAMQQFEEPIEINPGSKFKTSPALRNMIREDELGSIFKASDNALKHCDNLAVCKGTYDQYTVFIDKKDKVLMSFMRQK